jgi:hypothetical protein
LFKQYGIQHIRFVPDTPYGWFAGLNKPLSLLLAEPYVRTPAVAWLDSHLLVLEPPTALELHTGEDFLGCAVTCELGTMGPGDPLEALWQANCRSLGLDLETLPWVVTGLEKQRVRLLWNGGVFVYRRTTGFAEEYLKVCTQLLNARHSVPQLDNPAHLSEWSAIGLTMAQLKLNWRPLPYAYHYLMDSHQQSFSQDALKAATLIHCSDLVRNWQRVQAALQETHPLVADWLRTRGVLHNPASLVNRGLIQGLRIWRKGQEKAYLKTCKPLDQVKILLPAP